jgi:hypothetical protein
MHATVDRPWHWVLALDVYAHTFTVGYVRLFNLVFLRDLIRSYTRNVQAHAEALYSLSLRRMSNFLTISFHQTTISKYHQYSTYFTTTKRGTSLLLLGGSGELLAICLSSEVYE